MPAKPTTVKVDFSFMGRSVKFEMLYDSMFVQERNLALCLQQQGTCEPELTRLLLRTLREGQLAVDVGAAVGFFTVMMAKLVGPTGSVCAFEPDPRNSDRLIKNLNINDLGNVTVIPQAVSNRLGRQPMSFAKDSGENSLGETDILLRLEDVDVVALDNYERLLEASFVKIDAEGAELSIMRGADSMLSNQVPLWCCEINEKQLGRMHASRTALREAMTAYGYDGWLLPLDGSLPLFVPPRTNLVGGPANLNMLFASARTVEKHWSEVKLP